MNWKRFLHRTRKDEDFAEEIDSYLQHEIDRNLAAGMTPGDATAAARRKFGNITSMKERVHEMNTVAWIETVLQDLKHALRWMRRNPGFALVAVFSLALGIGANTAIFQLIDALRIRSLPVQQPQELVEVRIAEPRNRSGNFTGHRPELTYPLFEKIHERQQSFSSLFAWGAAEFDLSSGGEIRKAEGLWVSGDFFDGLRVPAVRGRLIAAADDVRGCAAPGVVISHGFWQREFGGRDSAIGSRLSLDSRLFDIIGVAPAGFFGMEVGRSFDVALPLCARALWPMTRRSTPGVVDIFTDRSRWWLAAAGRLKPGRTLEQADADVKNVSTGIFEETVEPKYPADDAASYRKLKLTAAAAGSGVTRLRTEYATPLWILLGATGLVLLIACANIANLMLARATARQREISIRLAIGASRRRLVRQLLTESALLSITGATLGLLLARTLGQFLVVFLSSADSPLMLPVETNWRILLYMAGLVVTTCTVFGLMPALRGTRVGPGAAMKASGRGLTGDRQRLGMRRSLVVSQVALSLVLLVGALLFARSLRNLVTLDSGFKPDGVIFMSVDVQRLNFQPERRNVAFQQILENLNTAAHVDAAAAISHTPMVNGWNENVRSKADDQKTPYISSNFERVGDGYFKAIGTPIIGGRNFDQRDGMGSPNVAIVDESFVDKILHGANPIGVRFEIEAEPGSSNLPYEIVGVVRNVKYNDLWTAFEPTAYLSDRQEASSAVTKTFVIRSSAPLTMLVPGVLAAIRDVHPAIGVEFQTFNSIIRDSLVRDRLMATLSSFFGLLAAALATMGLYGTLSYTVTQRRNEIGIRMALGAGRPDVIRMILREAAWLLAAGLTIGTIATLLATRTASALLFGLSPKDPLTIVIGVIGLAAVTLIASYIPARRAAQLEPTTVLREE